MRLLWLGVGVLMVGACRSPEPPATPAGSPADNVDTDTDIPDTDPPLSAFRSNSWLLEDLDIVPITDTDGDGTLDNKLPEVLEAVDLLMRNQDMSTAAINENIAANIAQLTTVVFLDADSDGDALEIDVLTGMAGDGTTLAVDPVSYDDLGVPRSQLIGEFVDSLSFGVSGAVLLRITMLQGVAPAPVQLQSVVLDGEITESELVLTGRLRGVIPVDSFIDEAIAPLIPPEGYEIFPGVISSRDEVLAIIRDLAPGLADVTLPDGSVGISAVFDLVAGEWEIP